MRLTNYTHEQACNIFLLTLLLINLATKVTLSSNFKTLKQYGKIQQNHTESISNHQIQTKNPPHILTPIGTYIR